MTGNDRQLLDHTFPGDNEVRLEILISGTPLTPTLSLYGPETWWTVVRRHGGRFLEG